MKLELTETLDENKKFTGKKSIKKCHDNGLLHRSVGIFIFSSKGELLLQKRSSNMTFFPGKYDCSSSGHVSYGEDIKYSANRELGEELGIKSDIKLIDKDILEEFSQGKFNIRHFLSLFEGIHDGPFKIQKDELDSIKFFSINEIKDLIVNKPDLFTKAFKLCFKIYINKNEIK